MPCGAIGKRPETYTDFAEMLDKAQLDAVAIISPTNVHAEHVRMAVEKGLHVFIEKPTGMNTAECAEIERLAAQHDKDICSWIYAAIRCIVCRCEASD